MQKNDLDAYKLDWGEVFVESYNTNTKTATLIYNFNFQETGLLKDISIYSIAHIVWVYKNLPAKSTITAIYDLRNRNIDPNIIKEFDKTLRDRLSHFISPSKVNLLFNK